jgi:dienelactone hydrolase
MIRLFLAVALLLAGCVPQPGGADMVEIPFGNVRLAGFFYTPAGPGPFPLVVINHGKNAGPAAAQPPNPMTERARQFTARGYAVLVPIRAGFGGAGGDYANAPCDQTRTGELQADSIAAAIAFAKTLPQVDAHHIVVIGQSEGGLATMALAARHIDGVVGLINMAGGLEYRDCPDWPQGDVAAFARYGLGATTPSLWVYGDNDAHWGKGGIMARRFFAAYTAHGAPATFVDIGRFEHNSHNLFASPAGAPIWLPLFQSFFTSLGLPFSAAPAG